MAEIFVASAPVLAISSRILRRSGAVRPARTGSSDSGGAPTLVRRRIFSARSGRRPRLRRREMRVAQYSGTSPTRTAISCEDRVGLARHTSRTRLLRSERTKRPCGFFSADMVRPLYHRRRAQFSFFARFLKRVSGGGGARGGASPPPSRPCCTSGQGVLLGCAVFHPATCCPPRRCTNVHGNFAGGAVYHHVAPARPGGTRSTWTREPRNRPAGAGYHHSEPGWSGRSGATVLPTSAPEGKKDDAALRKGDWYGRGRNAGGCRFVQRPL